MWFRDLTVVLFRALAPACLAAFALWGMLIKRSSGRAEVQANNLHWGAFIALTALILIAALVISFCNWPVRRETVEAQEIQPDPRGWQ